MPGPVPGIHVFHRGKTWMAGTSPAMTKESFRLRDHAHDVGLFHDQEVLAIDLHFGARPLAEQHTVARLEIDRDQLAVFVAPTGPDSDDLAFGRLLLGGVRNDDAALGLLIRFDAADHHAVMQGTEVGFGHRFLKTENCERVKGLALSPRSASSAAIKGPGRALSR